MLLFCWDFLQIVTWCTSLSHSDGMSCFQGRFSKLLVRRGCLWGCCFILMSHKMGKAICKSPVCFWSSRSLDNTIPLLWSGGWFLMIAAPVLHPHPSEDRPACAGGDKLMAKWRAGNTSLQCGLRKASKSSQAVNSARELHWALRPALWLQLWFLVLSTEPRLLCLKTVCC